MLSKGIVSSLHIAKVTSPTLDHFVQTYEEKLLQVVALSENQRLSEAFQIKSFSQEIGDDLQETAFRKRIKAREMK
ncbi:hypothetical protein [Lysinibacillus capsici]|uniref:hypothetical protein n=1 Tax=Lysinibacillus capsici TaxID=2115968 RepID=UPI002FDE55B8